MKGLGDSASFEAAFTQHFPAVHNYLARRVGSALADDLAAETFATAFRRRTSYDPGRASQRSWFFGIATNLLRAHWRAEQHALSLNARFATDEAAPERSADDALVAAWLAPRLAAALSLLPLQQREVLLLHSWAELSNDEIASALDIPLGTVKSRLSRGCAELRTVLGDFDFSLWVFAKDQRYAGEEPTT